MAGEIEMTVIGNLTADPELRFLPSGVAVANFTVASTPRKYNSQTSQWEDGDTTFIRCSVFREYAENVTESLNRGMRVIVKGRFKVREYEADGQKRQSSEIEVDEVGPALRYASARVTRAERGNGGGGTAPAAGGGWGQAPAQAPAPAGGGWGQAPAQGAPQWGQPPQQAPAQASTQAPAQAPAQAQQGGGWGAPPGQYDQPPF